MKKFLFIIIAAFTLVTASFAQATSFSKTITNPLSNIVNTGVDTLTTSVTNSYYIHGLQLTVTKVSGTVGGSAVLYGTIDGTNWVATGDTVSLTNVATQSTILTKTNSVYTKYQWRITGTGTMSARATAYIIGQKYF